MKAIISLLFLLLTWAINAQNSDSKPEMSCCVGRCTGLSNCKVCTNCSRCVHCNSGGSCGVCIGSYTPSPTVKIPKQTYKSKSYSTPENSVLSTRYTVTVNADILNLRSGPGTEYQVLFKLSFGEELTVLSSPINGDWIKVSYKISNQLGVEKEMIGYVTSTLVSN